MPIGIDHVVIAVNDLEAATRNFQNAGFTVVPGGKHHGGTSTNALIAFQDGTYLELIAFMDDAAERPNAWSEILDTTGEGLVVFALRTHDLDAEVEALRKRGLQVLGPTAGGRVRPDGQRVDWRTIQFDKSSLPFYCHDETDRRLRVPDGNQAVHPNGVTGVIRIVVPSSDFEADAAAWRAVTALDGNAIPGGSRFAVGPQAVDLIEREGSLPLRLVLSSPTGDGEALPSDRTHGAELIVSSLETISA